MADVVSTRPVRFRRTRAVARAVATRVGAARTRVVERVRRIYVGARGGVSRAVGVARNAGQRAAAVLSGGTGRIVAMVVGVAALVALIPLVRKLLKLEGNPNAGYWLAGAFLLIGLLFWRVFNKPSWALMAAAVAGFVGGSELLSRFFAPANGQPALASNTGAPAQIPDRAASGAPVPSARPAASGVNIPANRAAVPTG
jgi:hypothetical protein